MTLRGVLLVRGVIGPDDVSGSNALRAWLRLAMAARLMPLRAGENVDKRWGNLSTMDVGFE